MPHEKTYEHNLVAQVYCYFSALGFGVTYFSVHETQEGKKGYDVGLELEGFKRIGFQLKRPDPGTKSLTWELRQKQHKDLVRFNSQASQPWLLYAFPGFRDPKLLNQTIHRSHFVDPSSIKVEFVGRKTKQIGIKSMKAGMSWAGLAIEILRCKVGETLDTGIGLEDVINRYEDELFDLTAMLVVNPERLKAIVLSRD